MPNLAVPRNAFAKLKLKKIETSWWVSSSEMGVEGWISFRLSQLLRKNIFERMFLKQLNNFST